MTVLHVFKSVGFPIFLSFFLFPSVNLWKKNKGYKDLSAADL